jgi:hypothetical protein
VEEKEARSHPEKPPTVHYGRLPAFLRVPLGEALAARRNAYAYSPGRCLEKLTDHAMASLPHSDAHYV